MTEAIQNFKRFKILLQGHTFSHAEIFTIGNISSNSKPLRIDLKGEKGDPKILGIEIKSGGFFEQNIDEILKKKTQNVGVVYFFFDEFRYIRGVKKVIKKHSLTGELYGIDPGYYYSFVPLCGPNCKSIQKIILNLKNNTSRKEYIKHYIKNCLIILGLSHFLYENFIIVACPLFSQGELRIHENI